MYKIDMILNTLNYCNSKPIIRYSAAERIAKKTSYISLIISTTLLIIGGVMALIHSQNPFSDYMKITAIIIVISSEAIAIFSLIPEPAVGIFMLFFWKKQALISLHDEIKKDEIYANRLSEYTVHELEYAQYWLNLKISRIESRIKFFLVKKRQYLHCYFFLFL